MNTAFWYASRATGIVSLLLLLTAVLVLGILVSRQGRLPGLPRFGLERWSGLVTARGACRHPDGTVRFVRSALQVFGPDIDLHAQGRCSATDRTPFLPVPDGRPRSKKDWI
jgi:hypothetical protein